MIWTLTNGLKGHDVIVQGVAARLVEALGFEQQHKVCVAPSLWRWIAPYGTAPYCDTDPQLAPPWPKILISCGRTALPAARHLRQCTHCFTVAMQPPRFGHSDFDLVWAPAHNRLAGPNVISTLTAPHSITHESLKQASRRFAADFESLPRPIVGVLIGGKSANYRFSEIDQQRLVTELKALETLGAGLIITCSRRTSNSLIGLLKAKLSNRQTLVWQDSTRNPYQAILGLAQALVVTADSINMIGEACLPAVPVHVFHPQGGGGKFRRFHMAMMAAGYTERLEPERLMADIETGDTHRTSLNSTEIIADAILNTYRSTLQDTHT